MKVKQCEKCKYLCEYDNILFCELEYIKLIDLYKCPLIEYCPTCKAVLKHIDINGEDVYGCSKCKKEIDRNKAIKFSERIKKV